MQPDSRTKQGGALLRRKSHSSRCRLSSMSTRTSSLAASRCRLSVFDLLQRFPEIVGELPRCLQHDADKMVAGTVLSPDSLSP